MRKAFTIKLTINDRKRKLKNNWYFSAYFRTFLTFGDTGSTYYLLDYHVLYEWPPIMPKRMHANSFEQILSFLHLESSIDRLLAGSTWTGVAVVVDVEVKRIFFFFNNFFRVSGFSSVSSCFFFFSFLTGFWSFELGSDSKLL